MYNKSRVFKAELYFIFKCLEKNVIINDNMEFELTTYLNENKNKSLVRSIQEINYNSNDYVYDIETENGRFQAGIGEVICKNTDSVFVLFNTETLNKMLSLEKVQNKTEEQINEYKHLKEICRLEAMTLGKEACKKITKDLFTDPVSLEFEKVYDPFIVVAKKRYFGGYYSKSHITYDYKECKGLIPTKRDVNPLSIEVYNKAIELIVDKGKDGIPELKEYVKRVVRDISENRIDDYEKFTLVKTLNDTYKTQTVDNQPFIIIDFNKKKDKITLKGKSSLHMTCLDGSFYVVIKDKKYKTETHFAEDNLIRIKLETPITDELLNEKFPDSKKRTIKNSESVTVEGTVKLPNTPHVVLARKLAERNPNNKPQSNDKISYVFIKTEKDTDPLYKKVEDPDYAKRKGLRIDDVYYIQAIKTPLSQILDLINPELTIEIFGN